MTLPGRLLMDRLTQRLVAIQKTINVCVDCTLWENNPLAQHQVTHLFANTRSTDEDIYPSIISEITETQAKHQLFSKYSKDTSFKNKDSKLRPEVINDIRILTYAKKRLVIPTAGMQNKVIQWYLSLISSTHG
jgi:hypothetical protein